ncbi:MAG: cbb3-type cytochrome oxidase assembly protein CcoS [Acetobacteraceae bacterium]|nr:cbb3-type cytochrome oxidase assembly protein CcoS [Acetobacteraceae bacterium]
MTALLWLIPLTLALGLGAVALFAWTVRSGQYDDLDAAAYRVLRDDDAPARRPPPPQDGA